MVLVWAMTPEGRREPCVVLVCTDANITSVCTLPGFLGAISHHLNCYYKIPKRTLFHSGDWKSRVRPSDVF